MLYCQKQLILNYLIHYRMSGSCNYIYKQFNSMAVKYARYRRILRFADINKLNWQTLEHNTRWLFINSEEGDRQVEYIVGQSQNEEMLYTVEGLLEKPYNG